MYKYLKLLRVKHYIKNFLIFCPAFFGRTFFYGNAILECGIAFLTFSFLSSIVYIINDIQTDFILRSRNVLLHLVRFPKNRHGRLPLYLAVW